MIIRTHYHRGSQFVNTLLPEITPATIKFQANRMGISNRPHWTDDEISIMRECYSAMGTPVASKLPGSNAESIMHCAKRLGLKRRR